MKNFIKIFLIFNAFCQITLADTKNVDYKFSQFDDAKKSSDFIKFIGSSTKLKVFTTEFEGYSKSFVVNYDAKNNQITNFKITIDSAFLDTDSSSRDEKMRSLCLNTEKYKTIVASTQQIIELKEQNDVQILVSLLIKDRELIRPLKFSMIKDEQGWRVNFSSDFSFKDAGIEDPSIAIAKVHENFRIEGSLLLK
jgi:polyisoprenoid-binding protein YceI